MLRKEERTPGSGDYFFHYEPPYVCGMVLSFPNDPGGTVAIEKIGAGKVVDWRGRNGDTVKAPVGTQFRPLPLLEAWQGLRDYLFMLREDGWLDFRFAPRGA